MTPVANDNIVIVGAGIIGLDVAYVLAQRGFGPQLTVVAEHWPGDTSAHYTSPWAGCNFSAISGADSNALRWDKLGYSHLAKLASECSEEAYVQRTASKEYWDEDVPYEKIKHMSEYLDDFRLLPSDELPPGVRFGIAFTAMTINAPKHCEFLHRKLRDQYGVRFIRRKLPSIDAAYLSPSTEIVFNCTGIAAKTLPGVEDADVFPTRGQVVLARAPRIKSISMRHGKGYETYLIPRPGSNGNVVLGGYVQKGVCDASTYSHETQSILDRTRDLDVELRDSPHEVLATFAGLRPSRVGGARVERDVIEVNGTSKVLVHNYGAGGTGFQAGYGMALDAVRAVEKELKRLQVSATKARL